MHSDRIRCEDLRKTSRYQLEHGPVLQAGGYDDDHNGDVLTKATTMIIIQYLCDYSNLYKPQFKFSEVKLFKSNSDAEMLKKIKSQDNQIS